MKKSIEDNHQYHYNEESNLLSFGILNQSHTPSTTYHRSLSSYSTSATRTYIIHLLCIIGLMLFCSCVTHIHNQHRYPPSFLGSCGGVFVSAATINTTTTTTTTRVPRCLFDDGDGDEQQQQQVIIDRETINDEYLIIFQSYHDTREHNSIISNALLIENKTSCYSQFHMTNFATIQQGGNHENNNNNNSYAFMFRDHCPSMEPITVMNTTPISYHGSLYSIIERNNTATQLYPSDFAIIRFNSDDHYSGNNYVMLKECILKTLKSNKHLIKYVVPHAKMTVQLQSRLTMDEESGYDTSPLMPQSRTGRRHTQWSRKLFQKVTTTNSKVRSLNLREARSTLAANLAFQANELWERGITGSGVHVAVFDTGLCPKSYGFKHIEEQINYTYEDSPYDNHGHGTFVSSIIAGNCTPNENCCSDMKGLAPDARLHIFKVFTKEQVSYTSWFLDAFNYALQKRINILNLSIGGPDYMDMPFVDKVRELAANNIIVVSAIGNDGPLYGTLNNPADLTFVLGIGAIDHNNMRIAPFSSRGMSIYELSTGGYGRMKPDLVTYGVRVLGHGCDSEQEYSDDKCQKLSGTSVASPVATGVITLLLSAWRQLIQKLDRPCANFPELENEIVINPASIKQILIQSAQRVPQHNMFEQGAGRIDLLAAFKLLEKEVSVCHVSKDHDEQEDTPETRIVDNDWPRVTLHPTSLDLTDCPYTWPFCAQPFYYSQLPVVINVTVLNGMSQYGEIVEEPEFIPNDEPSKLVDMKFTYSKMIKVWTGYLALHISVSNLGRFYSGTVSGRVKLTVSGRVPGSDANRYQTIYLPIRMNVIPTPMRSRRILWDQYHQLIYPSASYVPKDDLTDFVEPEMNHNVVDWNGDHPHTNFLELFTRLLQRGYYVEVLNSGDWTTFDAHNYGTLLIVDPEEEIMEYEAQKLESDIRNLGLSVVIFADWYNEFVIRRLKFLDDNTQSIWIPVTGGSNIPALNGFLHRFGIMLGDTIFTGPFNTPSEPEKQGTLLSSTSITRFPLNGELFFANVSNETPRLLSRDKELRKLPMRVYNIPILGLYQVTEQHQQQQQQKTRDKTNIKSGKIVVFGDSNCIDLVSKLPNNRMCLWLLEDILAFTNYGKRSKWMHQDLVRLTTQDYVYAFGSENTGPNGYSKLVPRRLDQSPLSKYSRQPLSDPTKPIATFNVSQWPKTSSPFYFDTSMLPDKPVPAVISARTRIIMPVMVVFIMLLFLVYMSFSRRKIIPQQEIADVRPHAV